MEILKLEYNASVPSISIVVAATREIVNGDGKQQTVVVVGDPKPQTTMTLDELRARDSKAADDLADLLERLEPLARTKAADDIVDPAAVMRQAVANARAAEALEANRRQLADDTERAAKLRKINEDAALEAQATQAAAEAEAARIDLEITTKRVELAHAERAIAAAKDAAGIDEAESAS